MERDKVILLDTSVLIDYFRKPNKETTFLVELPDRYDFFAVSVVTKFEIYIGSTPSQEEFWDNVFENFSILPLTEECMDTAVEIQKTLKRTNQQLDFADLLIAATAKTNSLAIATLNVKHFGRIVELVLVTKEK